MQNTINKKTLVLGASENPSRYSNRAIHMLRTTGHEVVAIGAKSGVVLDVEFGKEQIPFEDIDTVTLYLNPFNQKPYYDYILYLNPKRIIFNPGTENRELAELAYERGIEPIAACTLVMLSTNQY
jgi:predicted CoA-binding protein